MKLTTQLIFDCLAERFDVRYDQSSDKSTVVGRPLFYDGECAVDGHICILPSAGISPSSLESGAYVSVGTLPCDIPAPNVELMTVYGDVSPTRLINEIQQIFDHYDEWENELSRIIDENTGYPALIQCSAKYLDCAMSLVDANFSVVAIASSDADAFRDSDNKVSDTVMSAYITDPHFSQGLYKDGVFEFKSGVDLFLSYNIKKDGRNLGRVTLVYDKKKSKGSYVYLLNFLASKIDIMLSLLGSFLVSNESLSSLRELLGAFLDSRPMDTQHVSRTLAELGWSYRDTYMLIRLQPEFRHEWQLHAAYLIPNIERLWPGACAVEKDAYVAVLVNLDVYAAKSGKDFFQELAVYLRDNLLLAGLSRPFHGLDKLPSYYKQTELAVSLGREAKPMSWSYRFDDYVLSYLLKYGTQDFSPDQICSRGLLDLMEYDRENNTEYYKTLRTFFHNRFNYTHAAESLYIHRTTLIKRVERIARLTGVDLEDPDENLYIELSFRYLDRVL